MRFNHRARVESSNLIVINIGGNKGLRRKAAINLLDVRGVKFIFIKPAGVIAKIFTNGCHNQRFAFKQLQIISNIASGAAKFTAHLRHIKCHA